jgi:hypothetical protein
MVKTLRIIRIAALFAVSLIALVAGGGQAFATINLSITPANGPTSGGTAITVSGDHFNDGYNGGIDCVLVDFNSVPYTIINNQTLTTTTPADSAGEKSVLVFYGAGNCLNVLTNYAQGNFTYVAPPTVTAVTPSSGSTVGGTSVFISGTSFTTATSVTFGGTAVTSFTVVNDTTIQVTTPACVTTSTPACNPGAVNIVIVNSGGTGTGVGLYTYVLPPAPNITSISPTSGPTSGGTSVTINGNNFGGATSVTFGSYGASFTVVASSCTPLCTQITATTPPGTLGAADVSVTTPSGTATDTGAFTYVPPAPTVSTISPNNGPPAGGTVVNITGSHFTGATAVTIGGAPATGVTVISDSVISATTAAHVAQANVDVDVTTPYGTGTGAGLYTYGTPAPSVTSITPPAGGYAGGTAVTITGAHFTGATAVTIGSPVASFTVTDDNHISATTAAHAAGVVDVSVTTAIGTGTGFGMYTYTPPPPVIASVSPNNGPTTGFTPITITGSNFTATKSSGVVLVTVGGTAATGVTVVNDTTITALTPAGIAGPADVVLSAPFGQSTTGTGAFTYTTPVPGATPAPTVTAISPSSGSTNGGTSVTITGTNFVTGSSSVTIGGNPATGVTVVNPTTITAITPAHAAGATDVIVITPNGGGVGAGLYTYVTPTPTVTSISPSSGPVAGGTFVTITGMNFITGGTTVTFGGNAAVGMTVVNSTTITASTPAHAAGAVSVVVTTAGGNISTTFTYIQAAPTLASIDPNTGPTTGGTVVTITGTNLNGASAVKFGANNATSFTFVSATQITATSPAGSLGAVYVTVTTPGGTSAASAGAQFTYAVPADSQRLRALQVTLTPMIAQVSGQAITGAVDSAIGVGFSGVPGSLTPNGSGFTYYFYADPEEKHAGGSASNGGGGASNGGVQDFVAAPDRRASRVDDAFSALAYSRTAHAQAPARSFAPAREWLAWIDVRGSGLDAHGSNDTKGVQTNLIAGLTRRVTKDFLVGVLGGYEYFNYSSDMLSGRLTGGGWTIGSYLGWRLAPGLRFDAAAAYSGIGYDGTAGTASGNFFGNRWLASAGLTGTVGWRGVVLEPSARVYALWENETGYTDSLGTAQAERNFTTGRASGGTKVSYPMAWKNDVAIAPYVGVYGDYYFSSDDATTFGVATTPLLQGWSARVTSGVAMRFDRGTQLSIGGELGGIGSSSNTYVYSLKVHGSVPF